MITFKKISIRNFLSIGNEPVVINFQNGLNIISGENKDKQDRKNGIGKTSIISAFYFGIFGKSFVNINKGDLVNKQNKKDTEVIIEFSKNNDDYIIIRKLKPSSLDLIKNGKSISQNIKETDSDILKILNVNESVFQNCVLMSVTSNVPFMEQSKTEKRKFIEGIFDLSIFNELLKESRKDLREFKDSYNSNKSKIEEIEKNIKIYKEHHINFEKEKESEIKTLNDKIENISKNLKEINYKSEKEKLNNKSIEIKNKKKDLKEKINKDILIKDEINKKYYEFISESKTIKKSIKNSLDADQCPTCLRAVDDHTRDLIEKHNNNIIKESKKLEEKANIEKENLKSIQEKIDKIENSIEKLNEYISKIDKQINNFQIEENKYEYKLKEIGGLKSQIQNISQKENKFTKLYDNSKVNFEKIKNEQIFIEKNIYIHENLTFIFSEEGVKSYIIKKMLELLNSKISFYLNELDSNCRLVFDEYFEEKIQNEKGYECSYFNFSSGERRTIDIAIMFAFMDIQKLLGKFETNLEFYDELIDSSLDELGVDLVLQVLKKKSDKKGIYLITHRKELDEISNGDIIWLVKENGITYQAKQ